MVGVEHGPQPFPLGLALRRVEGDGCGLGEGRSRGGLFQDLGGEVLGVEGLAPADGDGTVALLSSRFSIRRKMWSMAPERATSPANTEGWPPSTASLSSAGRMTST